MKRFLVVIFFLSMSCNVLSDDSVDDIKGVGTSIWSAIKSVPQGFVSFWKNIKLLGAAPGDYYYQYLIFNDTDQPVYVGTQTMRSIMGAIFPQANSWNCGENTKVAAYSMYPSAATIAISSSSNSSKKSEKQSTAIVTNCVKENYYFEMFIKTTDKDYSNHMPYLEHDDVLYQIDKLNLAPDDKDSNHCDIFRIYMGKDLAGGKYVHSLKAEIVGSVATNTTPFANAISMDSNVSAITIKNSTKQDYYVGFYPQTIGATATSQTPASIPSTQCVFLGLVEKKSFGLLSITGSVKSFNPGTIAIYSSKASSSPVATISVPKYSFNSLTYTLEIYQDQGQSNVNCHWQGIMPGHYDMPTGRIKDITPIIGAFWYQSVAQANQKQSGQSSGYDLSGFVWIISYEEKSKTSKILAKVSPGQYVQFQVERAVINDRKKLYFLYSDTTDSAKIDQFVQNFVSGKVGASIMNAYENKLDAIINSSFGNKTVAAKNKAKGLTSNIATVVNEVALNTIEMNRGQIVDSESGVTAFLLGTDIFMPFGMGAAASYYFLTPSFLNTLPTNAVQNYMSSTPQGLPTTIINSIYAPTTYSIAASN